MSSFKSYSGCCRSYYLRRPLFL